MDHGLIKSGGTVGLGRCATDDGSARKTRKYKHISRTNIIYVNSYLHASMRYMCKWNLWGQLSVCKILHSYSPRVGTLCEGLKIGNQVAGICGTAG